LRVDTRSSRTQGYFIDSRSRRGDKASRRHAFRQAWDCTVPAAAAGKGRPSYEEECGRGGEEGIRRRRRRKGPPIRYDVLDRKEEPMSLTLDEIHAEALNLPEESRAELVERLMLTLVESPDPEVEQAWLQEAERRRQQLLDGSVQGIPAEVVFARLSAKHRR
jgi:putative addiction module component (TIGR02574 family)